MSKLIIQDEKIKLAVLEVIRIFESLHSRKAGFKNLSLEIKEEASASKYKIIAVLAEADNILNSISEELALEPNLKSRKQSVKRLVYRLLSNHYEVYPPWGILVGVRPTKLVSSLFREGNSKSAVANILAERYLLSADKIELLMQIAGFDDLVVAPKTNSLAIYINIPYCPSRCLYCSFAAEVMRKEKGALSDYIQALLYEITASAPAYKDYQVESIYFGGGTPSMLAPDEVELIYRSLADNFDVSELKEFCFEAGRPKTITAELLSMLQSLGVDRISINPQTTNDKTLELIGRSHNSEAIVNAFALARQYNFKTINADVIAGLYGESLADFERTLADVIALKPENITVHSLSMKKGSRFLEEGGKYSLPSIATVSQQIKVAQEKLSENNYYPYYLYRQKKIAGNLENVGYCLSGHHGLYNMRIIEEKQTILAFGAAASNKFYNAETDKLNNFINIKNVKLYCQRVEEMAEHKIKQA